VEERRRRLPMREVVAALLRKVDVGAEGGGPDAVREHLPCADEVEQVGRGEVGDEQRQRGRGKDPPRAADVEAAERDAPAPLGLREQEPGDQVPGEDEEDVDADEAAAEERDARVAQDDEQNRDRSETLDVVSVRRARPPGRAYDARFSDS